MDPACAVHLTQKCCVSMSVPMHVCFDYEQFSKQVKSISSNTEELLEPMWL